MNRLFITALLRWPTLGLPARALVVAVILLNVALFSLMWMGMR